MFSNNESHKIFENFDISKAFECLWHLVFFSHVESLRYFKRNLNRLRVSYQTSELKFDLYILFCICADVPKSTISGSTLFRIVISVIPSVFSYQLCIYAEGIINYSCLNSKFHRAKSVVYLKKMTYNLLLTGTRRGFLNFNVSEVKPLFISRLMYLFLSSISIASGE